MPRSGKTFKMYETIWPSETLYLNDVVDNGRSPNHLKRVNNLRMFWN